MAKFKNPLYSKQDRLFRYLRDVGDITAELIQCSCDYGLGQHKGGWLGHGLSSAGSLKIQDYKNTKSTQTKARGVAHKGCQAELQSYESQAYPQDHDSRTRAAGHQQALVADQEVLLDIDALGASLDRKIDDFVRLLSSLKQLGQPGTPQAVAGLRKPAAASGTALVGEVSKIIHELTEDTR